MGYSVFRIDDVANRRGEDFLNRIVSTFSCVKNREVDEFLAKNEIRAAQERVGGQMEFLEMEHGNAFLESFYRENGFVTLGQRNSEEDRAFYDQMFIFLK